MHLMRLLYHFSYMKFLLILGIVVILIFEGTFLFNSAALNLSCSDDMEFCNKAKQMGLAEELGWGRGAAFVDIDGDGWEDIWVSDSTTAPAQDGYGVSKIFRNQGDGTFIPMDIGIEHKDLVMTYSGSFADFDNDGDPDLLMANGGYAGRSTLALYRNDLKDKGKFINVTKEANITDELNSWWGASWADYDLDGWLDFIAIDRTGRAWLYNNLGDSTFAEVGEKLGVVSSRRFIDAKNPVWFDYDQDGDPDLFIAAVEQHLYRNDGKAGFIEVTETALISPEQGSFAAAAADFNQDGLEDLYLGRQIYQDFIFLNQGDGTFVGFGFDVGLDMGTGMLRGVDNTMGLGVGDINEDGYPDILIGTGDTGVGSTDLVYCNDTKFSPNHEVKFKRCDTWVIQGHGEARTHGIILGDPDHDGDVDIFYNLGGHSVYDQYMGTDTRSVNAFYIRNPKSPINTATIHLEGTKSNRDAIGARIKVEGSETHYYTVRSTQAFMSQNSDWMVVSLGDAESATVTVTWPSGNHTVTRVRAGERTLIREK